VHPILLQIAPVQNLVAFSKNRMNISFLPNPFVHSPRGRWRKRQFLRHKRLGFFAAATNDAHPNFKTSTMIEGSVNAAAFLMRHRPLTARLGDHSI
jgi:hypothetical protein